jgi:hypothetical protein
VRALEPELRALSAAGLRRGSYGAFGSLPRDGYDPPPGHREGEGFPQRGLFAGQASFGRSASKTEWVYGFKVALVVDPAGVITAFGLAEAASEERPIAEALIASERYDAYPWPTHKGFTGLEWERRWLEVYGALVAATP